MLESKTSLQELFLTPTFPVSVAFLEMNTASSLKDSTGASGCTAFPSPAWMPVYSWNYSIRKIALYRALAKFCG